MAHRIITYMAPVDNLSAKFALQKERAGINDGGIKYFGSRLHKDWRIGYANQMANKFYMRKFGRSTAPSTNELSHRENFKKGLAWAKAAMQDLSTLTKNQLIWVQVAKDPSLTVGGYSFMGVHKTFASFMRSYGIRYTLDHSGTVPDSYQLPDPA